MHYIAQQFADRYAGHPANAACENLQNRDRKRINIGFESEPFFCRLFGRAVGRCHAAECDRIIFVSCMAFLQNPGQTKVCHLHTAIGRDHYVCRFYILMNQPVFMGKR